MYLSPLSTHLLLKNVIRALESRNSTIMAAVVGYRSLSRKIPYPLMRQSSASCYPSYPLRHDALYSTDTSGVLRLTTICDEAEPTNYKDSIDARFPLKSLLYQDHKDSLMTELNQCDTYQELINCMAKNHKQFQRHHAVQSVILTWLFHNVSTVPDGERERSLEALIKYLRPHVTSLDLNEMSCCYLYLRRMGALHTDPVLEDILMRALKIVESSKELLPLEALSRLLNGINTGREFHTPTVCCNFLPHVIPQIESCQSADDIKLLAICLINLQPLIDDQTLNAFKAKLHSLLDKGIINSNSPKAILKSLHFLHFPLWAQQNFTLIRDLLYCIEPAVQSLDEHDLKFISYIFDQQQEPAEFAKTLKTVTESRLSDKSSINLLESYLPLADPIKREEMIATFKQMLLDQSHWQTPNVADSFFKLLRGLKISNTKMCDAYWNGVLRQLNANAIEAAPHRYLRHCNRYMNFNNNLGGTYRNKELERRLSEMSMQTIENDLAGRLPSQLARLASFVMAYGHTPLHWKKFPNIILSKIITMSEQFTPVDCLYISRGIHIALEMRFRHSIPSTLAMQIATIDSVLTSCAERHLSREGKLSAGELNLIARSLNIRKSLKNSVVCRKALDKYRELEVEDLNSRNIRDIIYNFNMSNFLAPKTLEDIFTYIEQNHKHVSAETVCKVLGCAYNLGYQPERSESLDYASFILMRDFNHMSGLSMLQACLALCFYKAIPEDLINKVFCVKFIQRVEDEIQMCYSKATYPARVLNLIMQLNRTVCLDFPEAKVPWFQQNYIEAQMSKRLPVDDAFSGEVRKLLTTILKDENYYRCNHITPYGYQIDFVIHFDKDKKPIPAPVETTMLDRITKVAILLLKLDSFCENDLSALRGATSLKIKHLEMMGYKVLHVNEHEWYSKYMEKPGAKANYLQCLLQISS